MYVEREKRNAVLGTYLLSWVSLSGHFVLRKVNVNGVGSLSLHKIIVFSANLMQACLLPATAFHFKAKMKLVKRLHLFNSSSPPDRPIIFYIACHLKLSLFMSAARFASLAVKPASGILVCPVADCALQIAPFFKLKLVLIPLFLKAFIWSTPVLAKKLWVRSCECADVRSCKLSGVEVLFSSMSQL